MKTDRSYHVFEHLYIKIYSDDSAEIVNLNDCTITKTSFGTAFDQYETITAEEYAEIRNEVSEILNN